MVFCGHCLCLLQSQSFATVVFVSMVFCTSSFFCSHSLWRPQSFVVIVFCTHCLFQSQSFAVISFAVMVFGTLFPLALIVFRELVFYSHQSLFSVINFCNHSHSFLHSQSLHTQPFELIVFFNHRSLHSQSLHSLSLALIECILESQSFAFIVFCTH